MDYEELKRNIGKAGLSIKEFADLIKVSTNSITNLAKKDAHIPKNLAIISVLIGEMVDKDIGYKHLIEKLGLEMQKPRGTKGTESFVKKEDRKEYVKK